MFKIHVHTCAIYKLQYRLEKQAIHQTKIYTHTHIDLYTYTKHTYKHNYNLHCTLDHRQKHLTANNRHQKTKQTCTHKNAKRYNVHQTIGKRPWTIHNKQNALYKYSNIRVNNIQHIIYNTHWTIDNTTYTHCNLQSTKTSLANTERNPHQTNTNLQPTKIRYILDARHQTTNNIQYTRHYLHRYEYTSTHYTTYSIHQTLDNTRNPIHNIQ